MYYTRREALAALGAAAVVPYRTLRAATQTAMRGVFIIMATPFTETKAVDYEDLAGEVDYLERCGVQGMVWPQMASEYTLMTKEERMKGMEVLARTARGKKLALVLGVQGPNTEAALDYALYAEKLEPTALIALPPSEAKSLADFREYYRALLGATKRPLFMQTIGGAPGIEPTVEFIVGLAQEFPNFGYVKEEYPPVLDRMKALARHRPAIKAVFSGLAGRDMIYEMALGFDGTMPGAMYADIYAQVWELYQGRQFEKARDLFSKLLLMIDLDETIPHTRHYIMNKRGVFKTMVSRKLAGEVSREEIEEIEFSFSPLKPYLRA